jgi:hypothetical protein
MHFQGILWNIFWYSNSTAKSSMIRIILYYIILYYIVLYNYFKIRYPALLHRLLIVRGGSINRGDKEILCHSSNFR